MAKAQKELFSPADFELIRRYKDMPDPRGAYAGRPEEYFDTIVADERKHSYAAIHFIRNQGAADEERYLGYLFHSNIAKTIDFIREKVPRPLVKEYILQPLGRVRIKKQHITGADCYGKNRRLEDTIVNAEPEYEFTYLLVNEGVPLDKFIKENEPGCEELCFKFGELYAKLIVANLFYIDYRMENLLVVKDKQSGENKLKLIDLYDEGKDRKNPHTCSIAIIQGDIMAFKGTQWDVLAKNFTCTPSIYRDLTLIKEVIAGYLSVDGIREKGDISEHVAYFMQDCLEFEDLSVRSLKIAGSILCSPELGLDPLCRDLVHKDKEILTQYFAGKVPENMYTYPGWRVTQIICLTKKGISKRGRKYVKSIRKLRRMGTKEFCAGFGVKIRKKLHYYIYIDAFTFTWSAFQSEIAKATILNYRLKPDQELFDIYDRFGPSVPTGQMLYEGLALALGYYLMKKTGQKPTIKDMVNPYPSGIIEVGRKITTQLDELIKDAAIRTDGADKVIMARIIKRSRTSKRPIPEIVKQILDSEITDAHQVLELLKPR